MYCAASEGIVYACFGVRQREGRLETEKLYVYAPVFGGSFLCAPACCVAEMRREKKPVLYSQPYFASLFWY